MSDYSAVRIGKLKLKGDKKKKKKNKRKREDFDGDEDDERDCSIDVNDAQQHGDWFEVKKFEQINGSVCIELSPYQYIRSLDNGNLILGAPHSIGEGPDQEEIFIAIRVSPSQIALKSGYNKYLSVDKHRKIVGHSDAVGNKEHFDPIFEEGKLALSASNGCFVSVDENNELPYIIAKSSTVGPNETLKIRTNVNPIITRLERLQQKIPDEEKGSLKECELNYVKKFQSFQDKKIRLNKEKIDSLKNAKDEGRLHEEMLDRRSKMKSDKFCK
ncbi:Protein FRG1 [Sarcoptes scabiei]|uniref:Protein FRG1 n=1 Tax=Sarcoptes scabiei TaxID=52283 RepID=A0A834RAH8_SARSC|nr:Protein FRG1 [Sarcoptes scabiei]UXI19021.1 Translocation protein SEC62 [Sarcoptes scabiei]